MAEEMKMIQPLNLKEKSLNQIFVTIQMLMFLRQEIEHVPKKLKSLLVIKSRQLNNLWILSYLIR